MGRKWILFCCLFFALPLTGSIIKKRPVRSVVLPYEQLVCTKEDEAKIAEIITTVSEKNIASLGFIHRSHLDQLGAEIEHVHPLKFLAVILRDPQLKACMAMIWRSSFKRGEFLSKLSSSLSREAGVGRLFLYLDAFAKEIRVPKEQIKAYCRIRDWENLLLYLVRY